MDWHGWSVTLVAQGKTIKYNFDIIHRVISWSLNEYPSLAIGDQANQSTRSVAD